MSARTWAWAGGSRSCQRGLHVRLQPRQQHVANHQHHNKLQDLVELDKLGDACYITSWRALAPQQLKRGVQACQLQVRWKLRWWPPCANMAAR